MLVQVKIELILEEIKRNLIDAKGEEIRYSWTTKGLDLESPRARSGWVPQFYVPIVF